MFSLSSHAMGTEECQPQPGMSTVQGLVLTPGFLQVSQKLSLFPAPIGLKDKEVSFGILW